MTNANHTLIQQSMQAGFNGGWLAAHLRIAALVEESSPEFAAYLREQAKKPDAVEVVEVPPEGSEGQWLCPDCNGWHVPTLGGIRVGHPCSRTTPP